MHEEFVDAAKPGDGAQMEVDEQRFVDAKAELADLRATFDELEMFDFYIIYIALMRKFLAMCMDVLELSKAIKTKGREAESYIYEIKTIGRACEDMQTYNQHLMQQVMERVGMLNMINERHIFFEVVSENKPIKYKISLAKSGIKAKGNTKVR
ncbi:E3 ubiquitin protein ligase BRE1-like protein 2 isoform X2 [Tanacetum coccineum]